MRRILAGAAVAALLATGGVAVAGAADTSTDAPDAPDSTSAPERGDLRRAVAAAAFEAAAEAIGVSADELREQVRGGSTIAEIAAANGGDVQTVVDALVAAGTLRIDAALADGLIDADRAAQLQDRLPTAAQRFVDGSGRASRQPARDHGLRPYRRAAADVVAATVGIDLQQLRDEVRAGASVAEVAEAHGVSQQAVANALIAAATERIDEAVAAGRLDSERAEKLKARLPELAQRVLAFEWQQPAATSETTTAT